MQIKYIITEQDYIDFNLFHLKTSSTMKKSVFMQRVIGPAIFLTTILLNIRLQIISVLSWTIIMAIFSVLWYMLYPKRIEKDVQKKIRKMLSENSNVCLLGQHTLSTSDEGIAYSNDIETKFVKWQGIISMFKTEKHLYLYNSSVSAYIIPLDAFESPEISEVFQEELMNRTALRIG